MTAGGASYGTNDGTIGTSGGIWGKLGSQGFGRFAKLATCCTVKKLEKFGGCSAG